MFASDFDGGGKPDLAVVNLNSKSVSILRNNGDMTCCIDSRGNANGDAGDAVNVVDLTFLAQRLFQGGPPPPCSEEADANGSGAINVVDLTFLVQRLFQGGPPPPACP